MKVAVIGAAGGMGSFFTRYFLARGDDVRAHDERSPRRSALGGERKAQWSSSNAGAARGCDVTILAVPMRSTLKAAKGVVGSLRDGSTLVEISSVKGETLSDLRKLVGGKAKVLSIHPLFGPALESTRRMKIAVIGKGEDASLAARIFPDARIIPMGRKEHDRAMAVVLSLTHVTNVAYAATAAKFLTPEEFRRVSTPNSSMQLTLAEAVLGQDPELLYSIQATNPYFGKVSRAALRELKRVVDMVESSEEDSFRDHLAALSKRYKTGRRASAAIKAVYSAAERDG